LVVFRENLKEFLEELDELFCHCVQLVNVAVRVDVAEARAHGVVDEEQIGKLVPRAIVQSQRILVLDSVRANLHQGAIFGAAAGASVDPDHGPLSVRDVLVLEVPEEKVSVVLGRHFDVSAETAVSKKVGASIRRCGGDIPSMHLDRSRVLGNAGQVADIVIGCRLAPCQSGGGPESQKQCRWPALAKRPR